MIASSFRQPSLESTVNFQRRPGKPHRRQPFKAGPADSLDRTSMPGSRALVVRDMDGRVKHVQVSRWRRVTAGPRRRIADVVNLQDGVAVLVEKISGENDPRVISSAWQAYDTEGRLNAVLQLTADARHALLINYQTRQVCQLQRNDADEMQTVAAWLM